MVDFISWHEAQARAKDEPVVFAEVVSDDPEGQKLEIHVMTPTVRGLHEAERDDTQRGGPVAAGVDPAKAPVRASAP